VKGKLHVTLPRKIKLVMHMRFDELAEHATWKKIDATDGPTGVDCITNKPVGLFGTESHPGGPHVEEVAIVGRAVSNTVSQPAPARYPVDACFRCVLPEQFAEDNGTRGTAADDGDI
jgi:hypothetical protein